MEGQKRRREGGKEGRMSERVASCGSLYDSTNLLLQYCNNGEPLLMSAHHTVHTHHTPCTHRSYTVHTHIIHRARCCRAANRKREPGFEFF